MNRARAIAAIVLGSRGIAVTPVGVSSRGDESETLVRGWEILGDRFCGL
jgi:hypothetical protein